MSEKMQLFVKRIVMLIIFIISVALNIIGHNHIGPMGALVQLIGVAGLIFLLWNYNRKFK